MPRNRKPSTVSQALTWGDRGAIRMPSSSYLCQRSPSGSHWWEIESPNGATSIGICRYCGERRQFANTFDDVFNIWSSDEF